MRTNAAITAAGLAGLAALACAGSVQAHHSHFVYQTTPIWINGTVTRFELKNPHAITTLEGRSENGQVRCGPSRARPKPGSIAAAAATNTCRRSATRSRCAPTPTGRPKRSHATHACALRWTLRFNERFESSTTEGSSPRLDSGTHAGDHGRRNASVGTLRAHQRVHAQLERSETVVDRAPERESGGAQVLVRPKGIRRCPVERIVEGIRRGDQRSTRRSMQIGCTSSSTPPRDSVDLRACCGPPATSVNSSAWRGRRSHQRAAADRSACLPSLCPAPWRSG